jgi:murein DD-endopeptidase MepM/ murein hydrolase activator NlpD
VATGSFMYPVGDFVFTQGYGCSPYWFEPWEPAIGCNFHNGIDLAAPWYTPLAAADGGIVEYAGWCDCGLGYYVKIDHGNGFKTVYGHMAEQPWVATGQAVRQGEVIGPMGSTGNSTGPHVHFIVEVNGITDDPLNYL